jgi:TfoX/Sxy family transcriptional regulator of competence genes
MSASTTPDQRYAALVEEFLTSPGVTHAPDQPESKGKFGAMALKVDGRIFAMITRGRLVVKIPRRRVDALVAEGAGERFDPGHRRVMKEWLMVDPDAPIEWSSLAREAMEFVAGKS